jgi:hypothetical protein
MCGCGGRKGSGLSDSEAAGLVEDRWKTSEEVLPLGQVRVVRSNPDLKRREVLRTATAYYDALKNEGVVSIPQRVSLTDNRNFSWENFYELSQRGVQEKVLVARTAEGETRYRCRPDRLKSLEFDDALCVSQGSGKVEEIVRGEQVLIGTRSYHFFMGNYRWKWSPLMSKVLTALKEDRSEERKFLAIAEYDPFLKKWTLDDLDYAPRAGAFSRQKDFDRFLSMSKTVNVSGW